MGLLTQALAGAVQGGAGAAYQVFGEQYRADLQAERDAALAAKQEHMQLLSQKFQTARDDQKHQWDVETEDRRQAFSVEADKTKRQEQFQDKMSLIEAQAAENRITREEADKREAALRKELKQMDGATRREIAGMTGGKSGESKDADKPLTADKAMERGTMLMRAARNSDGQITDQYMYDEGKKLIKWAQTKAKGGIPEDPKIEGAFDSSVMSGTGTSDIGGLIGTAPVAQQPGPRKSNAVDKSRPVTKNGVTGYRQPDGTVLSATGKRLN